MEDAEKEPLRAWLDPENADKGGKLREYVFTVIKPFFMKVKPGPCVVPQIGDKVILRDPHIIEGLFYKGAP